MEKTEFEKISEYYSKIGEYRRNFYKNFLKKGHLCDYFRNGEWKVGYILDKNDYYFFVADKHRNIYFSRNEAEHNRRIASLKESGDWLW